MGNGLVLRFCLWWPQMLTNMVVMHTVGKPELIPFRQWDVRDDLIPSLAVATSQSRRKSAFAARQMERLPGPTRPYLLNK